jgi:GNAT superfamily N-acetyltransferase
MPVTISIRVARAEDVPALVQLRLANAERHAGLSPAGHRLPAPGAVRRYFEKLLSGSGSSRVTVLVAEVAGAVAGMAEIVVNTDPPDHQILVPRRAADVHTVVLETYRGNGVGTALVAAAERYAAQHGVSRLYAPILTANTGAVSFYSRAGFGDYGIILSKDLPG